MCGIVGAASKRNIVPLLLQGLKRLEYRGYDSCGIAVQQSGNLNRLRSTERVAVLEAMAAETETESGAGIAHTRWATHGKPSVDNAHPHFSNIKVAVVHNGIIENHEDLRRELQALGYTFTSQTDTEVIAHLVAHLYDGDLLSAVTRTISRLRGAYAIAVMHVAEPLRVVGARHGSPLVLGAGEDENFLASDAMALAGVTDQIVYLEEGDVVDMHSNSYHIFNGEAVTRPVKTVLAHCGGADLGPYRHFMQKEIFEQPAAIGNTLESIQGVNPDLFGEKADTIFRCVDKVLILACGTSFYSGSTAKYWLESIAKIPCSVEIASEYRYRDSVPDPRTLVVTISQSGETADTLAALKHAQSMGMKYTMTICNVATSAMVRETALNFITRAGAEVGVASTKAFTTQLVGLFLLTLSLAKVRGHLSADQEAFHLASLRHLPLAVQSVLALEPQIISWAEKFAKKDNALFLGRGVHYPIALEGALKLKEITYIHAEAYSAGELKHGPLALVTSDMPVVVIAPNDALLEKLKSNMAEVSARGGELYVFADSYSKIETEKGVNVIHMPEHYGVLSPILHVLPLQLLSYHTACVKGTDVDKPRNLAKSVTTE